MNAREITPAARRRRVVPLLLAVFVLLISLYVVMPWISSTGFVRGWAERTLARATHYDIHFKRLRVGYDGSVTLELASVSEPHRPAFVSARQIELRPSPLAWIRGRIGTVSIDNPHVFVDFLPPPSGESRGEETVFPFDLVEVVEGVVHISSGDRELALGPLTLSVDHVEAGAGLRLGGEGRLAEATTKVQWSARVDSQLRTIEGEAVVSVDGLGRLTQHLFATGLPAPFEATTVNLTSHFHGIVTGRIAATIEVQVQPVGQKDPLRFTGTGDVAVATGAATLTLKGSQLRLASTDSPVAIDKVDVESTWKVQRPPGTPLQIDFDASLRTGEILWDRIYIDLARNRITARGSVQSADDEVRLENGRVTLGGVGELLLRGTQDARRTVLHATADVPTVSTVYELAVREPLRDKYPIVGRAAVGGRAKIAMDLERNRGGGRITGTVNVGNGTLLVTDPAVHIEELTMSMPVNLASDPVDEPARTGSLGIAAMQIGGVAVDHVNLGVDVEPNRLQLREPVTASVLGGTVELSALQAEHLATEQRAASVSLVLRNLDLGQLSRALGWPFLTGTISGSIAKMTLSDGQLVSDGEIEIKAFGGRIRMRNLKVEELFSRVPAIGFDLDVENVSLARLTHEFEVGQISGIVSGGVRDLAIVNGEPVRFEAWMENNAHSDEAQRISVAAIRQLSILGGSGGDPFSQGVLSFFDEYRYARIGFHSRLENDQFILRGVEEHDGKQYLVVAARLPPRVNVVSHNQVISFSEMMRRLERVFAPPPAKAPPESTPAGGGEGGHIDEHRDTEGQTATEAERGQRSTEMGGQDR